MIMETSEKSGEGGASLADGLARLLLTIRDAQADGSWDRMKLCGNPDCLWAFYDRSHSRQGAWCDMASCGNRLKNRSLRARRAQVGAAMVRACFTPFGSVTLASRRTRLSGTKYAIALWSMLVWAHAAWGGSHASS